MGLWFTTLVLVVVASVAGVVYNRSVRRSGEEFYERGFRHVAVCLGLSAVLLVLVVLFSPEDRRDHVESLGCLTDPTTQSECLKVSVGNRHGDLVGTFLVGGEDREVPWDAAHSRVVSGGEASVRVVERSLTVGGLLRVGEPRVDYVVTVPESQVSLP